MIDRRASLRLLVLGGAAAGLAACGGGRGAAPNRGTGTEAGSVLGILRANGLTRFLRAIEDAGLAETLAGDGPFTVFAPTDAAFAKLPKGTVEDLLKPENKATLQDILEYHVALGVMKPEQMTNGRSVGMANGGNVKFTVAEDGTVMINDARVLGSAPASNGLVVVIDKVLLPQ